jgi:hypothetical protein
MRRTLVLCAATILAALTTVRCGSSNSSPSTGSSPDGGGVVDAGGQPDAGGVGDGGGQPDAAGGGGQPEADGGGGGGQPDAGGGGGAQDECAGLGPAAVGQPTASAAINVGTSEACSVGSTDGFGTVALLVDDHRGGPPDKVTVHLFDPSGAELGKYIGIDTVLVEELEGFELRNRDVQQGELAAIDRKGSVVGTTGRVNEQFRFISDNPLGGAVALSVPAGSSSPNVIVAYDDRVNLRWRTQLSSTEEVVAVGVDRQGNSLVLLDAAARYGSGKLGGVWIDQSGNAGEEFEVAQGVSLPGTALLTPRVKSGLFLRAGSSSAWIRQFGSLGGGSPPPDWLAARPATRLHMARGGRAYAVISPASLEGGSCHATIEVVAPSGKSCGTAVFPAEVRGQFCAGALTVGYDGTVVDYVGDTLARDGTANRSCNFLWWTSFFGG